jgi:glycosyltransferase involved in cell wall biosynthesis
LSTGQGPSKSVLVSFIIPALNEAAHIGDAVASIRKEAGAAGIESEIIVVDHGSRDATVEEARARGAVTIVHPEGTIGAIRNVGARRAAGRILIFLDADVTLTPEWSEEIGRVLPALVKGERLITGSQCAPPPSRNLLLRHWFQGLAEDPRNTHVGTGHLIVSADGFRSIGGFDEGLTTGEDYEICVRAKAIGFTIINDPRLKVIHHDFPTGLPGFIRREAWHAEGDIRSLGDMLRSKVALGSLAYAGLHGLLIGSLLAGWRSGMVAAAGLLLALLLLSSFLKNRHMGVVTVLINTGIFYFYYLGRAFSLLRRLPRLVNPTSLEPSR